MLIRKVEAKGVHLKQSTAGADWLIVSTVEDNATAEKVPVFVVGLISIALVLEIVLRYY